MRSRLGQVKGQKEKWYDLHKPVEIYMGQDITTKRSGYVTLYGAYRGHIEYLDELAIALGFR